MTSRQDWRAPCAGSRTVAVAGSVTPLTAITMLASLIDQAGKVIVRTTAPGSGQFRVRLPDTTAEYAGIASTEGIPWLEALECAVGTGITVINVTVSRSGTSWYCTVLLQARPDTEVAGERPGDGTGRRPR